MKRVLFYCMLIALGWSSTACNDWLEVSPETEKDNDDMFSKESGFREVLTGAYIRMKSTSLYGQEMVCGTVEMLAQHWNNSSSGTVPYYLRTYDYTTAAVESALASIYNNLYRVVADVNGLLTQIDQRKEVFGMGHYELIKGEALALRAFCHFDVLRLFGPMPSRLHEDPILPYVTKVSNVPNVKLTWTEFTTLLLDDLQEAENCLKTMDPILSYSIADLNKASVLDDTFWAYRQMRMNYYAVCALKARVYLWMGNKKEALNYAQLVMGAKDPKGNKMYRLGNLNDCLAWDLTFSSEHILQLNVMNLKSTLGTGEAYQKSDLARFYDSNTTDIRYTQMWNEVSDDWGWYTYNYFMKYVPSDNMPSLAKNAVPLIRLYEMYLIAMECSTLEEATELYKEMCSARNITPEDITSAEQLEKILILEYNKEFYGEGQAFYHYKRLAVEDIYYAGVAGSVDTYVIPLPKAETL